MSDYSDWLSIAADDLTDEQRATFESRADAYYALPLHADRDPDDAVADSAEDDAALTAILQDILGEDSLMGAARRARQAEAELIGWVRGMHTAGTPERVLAEQSGISRMTIRKWLGK